MRAKQPRYWGFWTRGKLDILSRYLNAFTTAGNKLTEFIYLDLFAGQPENIERLYGKEIPGSVQIALDVKNPPFTRLRFFEKDHFQELEESLSTYKDRNFKVVPGDCNKNISEVLESLSWYRWAPTFAFIDPNGPDCHWSTLKTLSEFRKSRKGYKTEIWLLFADGMFPRTLPLDGNLDRAAEKRITLMFGTEDWLPIYKARCNKRIESSEAQKKYLNLMQQRLENELGYKWTHPLKISNENKGHLYHLIFATDHPAGSKIMKDLYKKARKELPKRQKEVKALREILKNEEAGQNALF